jgi:hypothetical protein
MLDVPIHFRDYPLIPWLCKPFFEIKTGFSEPPHEPLGVIGILITFQPAVEGLPQ